MFFQIKFKKNKKQKKDFGENLDEILRSRRDLGEILGEFLAADILRSRQDLGEILTRSWRDLGNLASQKLAKILAEITARSHRDLGQNFAGDIPHKLNN